MARWPRPAALPSWCAPLDRSIAVGTQTLGRGRFERAAGDLKAFRASPASDAAVLSIAAGLIQDMKLGRGGHTDLIAIGAHRRNVFGDERHTRLTAAAVGAIGVGRLQRDDATRSRHEIHRLGVGRR